MGGGKRVAAQGDFSAGRPSQLGFGVGLSSSFFGRAKQFILSSDSAGGEREKTLIDSTLFSSLSLLLLQKENSRKLGTAFPIFSSPCLCQKCGRAGGRDDRSWERRQSFLSDRRRLLAKSALGRETRKNDAAERRVSFRKIATYNFIFYVKVYTF